jgi:hypothetical protein
MGARNRGGCIFVPDTAFIAVPLTLMHPAVLMRISDIEIYLVSINVVYQFPLSGEQAG